jgi:hypothetical protein
MRASEEGAAVLRHSAFMAFSAFALVAAISGCAPTIDVKVEPINIYAKLDADIRIKLDKEVQTAIQQNPNLF